MAQSFCTRCGSRLAEGGSCTNAACVDYAVPAELTTSVMAASMPVGPPVGLDVFADSANPPLVTPAIAVNDNWVAAGDAGQNDVYIGTRLLFREPETQL